MQEPVVKDSVIKDPVIKEFVIKDPVIKDPVIKEPVIKKPAIKTPPEFPILTAPSTKEGKRMLREIRANTRVADKRLNAMMQRTCDALDWVVKDAVISSLEKIDNNLGSSLVLLSKAVEVADKAAGALLKIHQMGVADSVACREKAHAKLHRAILKAEELKAKKIARQRSHG